MITDPERLEELERAWLRERAGRRSFAEALDLYWSLWRHVRTLRPDWDGAAAWEADIQHEIETLRALHGRSG